MNLWTHCLLPKHGDLIHSLSFQLSYHFCEFNIEAPLLKTKSIQWPVQDINKLIPHQQWQHDNLSLVSDNEDEESLEYYDFRLGSQVISPENVQKVLSCCPNLQTLEFICPQTSEDEPPTILEMVPLVVYLTALVCNLPQLQHLKIQGYWINSIFSKCLLDPLKKLPQLTSVTCSRMCRDSFSDSVEEDQENFVKGLASLDHLTRLSCKQVDAVAPSWTTWSSPANLVDLTIINCKNLVIPDTSDFISTWAPNLTRLKLRFWTHNIDPKAKSELQAFEPHKHQFRLPQLTKLVLHHIPECDFFLSFSNCPNICRFTYHDLKAGSVPTFVDFLTKSNFLPNLKLLSLRQSRCYAKPVQEALHLDLTLVNQFCQQNHIALEVIDAWIDWRLCNASFCPLTNWL